MKIAVGILSYNPMSTLRMELLDRTLASIEKSFPSADRCCHDNLSTDGSQEAVTKLCEQYGTKFIVRSQPGGGHTPGHGRIHQMNWREYHDADIVVFSDDDMEWKSGSEQKVIDLWSRAPSDLAIVSGLLEPMWHWNTPRETLTLAHTNVLVRDSCPGAAWTFRAADWGIIKQHIVRDFGYDHKACVALLEAGYRVAQIDLADHIGWGFSTHGNEADQHPGTKPLDRIKWGV